MISKDELIKMLDLKPHPKEGGYFRETYRSDEEINEDFLPKRYSGSRSVSTAIYYLLTPETFSEMHKLTSDEVFHFYLGDPVTMLLLTEDGGSRKITLGNDISAGQFLQFIVPKGVWQGSFLNDGGAYALLGTTVAPGFDFSDYESGDRAELIKMYPNEKELISKLAR